jgi:hypothetical protein
MSKAGVTPAPNSLQSRLYYYRIGRPLTRGQENCKVPCFMRPDILVWLCTAGRNRQECLSSWSFTTLQLSWTRGQTGPISFSIWARLCLALRELAALSGKTEGF